jgi:ABC-2 type transport system permease protein
LWLYRRCLGAHLRSTLEYEKDFWVLTMSALLTQGVGLIFLSAIFRAIPQFHGWRFWDAALIYSMVVLTEGLAVLVAQGAWTLSFVVNTGGMDALLIRPFSPTLQVLSSQVGMNGIGNVLLGGALLATALAHVDLNWTLPGAALSVLLLLSAAAVKVGLNLLTNCAAFWLKSPFSMFGFAMHTFGELARFPITIYGRGIQLVLTVVLPYAFMSFFPATTVLHNSHYWWVGLCTPIVAAYVLALGAWAFRRGLLRYESAGH